MSTLESPAAADLAAADMAAADVPAANVADEVARAGTAFGSLVRLTGKAVADSQLKLNKTGAATTSALAETLVDVIAVTETVYDEDGNVDTSVTHTQQLPLITFIDPVIYEWSRVRVQGTFFATEISTGSSASTSSGSSSDASAQGGINLFIGGGFNRKTSTSENTEVTSTSTSDLSRGLIRGYAEISPRHDIGVPKPRQSVQGPRLAIIEGPIVDLATTPPASARTMDLVLHYFRRDGSPISGKTLSIETDGVPWSYAGGVSQTDAAGQVTVVLRRDFLDADADKAPIDVVVTARIGLVNNSTTVTF